MSNNKDALSMLQSRIARRAKIIDEIYQLSFGIVFYVDDQKADKQAMKEIVRLRRAQKGFERNLEGLRELIAKLRNTESE